MLAVRLELTTCFLNSTEETMDPMTNVFRELKNFLPRKELT